MFHAPGLDGHAPRTIGCAFIPAFAALLMQCAHGQPGTGEQPPLPQPATAAPTRVFVDCADCPEMVALPEGDVALGRYEVTLEEFRAFAEAVPDAAPEPPCGSSQLRRRRSWRAAGYLQTERHPVACVSWNDAQAYVGWLSLETGHQYRLPTDSEWDRGAAGSPSAGCNTFFTKERGTCVVGSYPPSNAGLFDMVGNLSEWTNDYWDEDRSRKVLRGAHWASYQRLMRPRYRRLAGPNVHGNTIGFRVARTLP